MDPLSVQRIVKKDLNASLKGYVDKSKGTDHAVYVLYTKKGNYVLRCPKTDRTRADVQYYAMKKWREAGAPVPKQILKRKNYMIEEYMDGIDLREAKLSFAQRKKIVREVGQAMRRMHSVKTKKFGFFLKPGVGKRDTWEEFVKKQYFRELRYYRRKKILSGRLDELRDCYKRNRHVLMNIKPSLLHDDMHYDNILVKNGKLQAIIDAGDAISGDPLYDVGVAHSFFRPRRLARYFCEGYGVNDMTSVFFGALCHSM